MRIERIHDAKTVAIYALCEVNTWEPRYIGKTIQYLHERHKSHIRAAKAAKRKAQTTCKRGHILSGDNLFMTSNGGRGCKECRKLHKATYRSRLNG
jgi:hypothetical protein